MHKNITRKLYLVTILLFVSFLAIGQTSEYKSNRLNVTTYNSDYEQSIQFDDLNGKLLVNIVLPFEGNRNTFLFDFKKENSLQKVEITVLNILGKEIYQFNLETLKGRKRWSMHGMQNGVYFYLLTVNNEKVYTKRFLKK